MAKQQKKRKKAMKKVATKTAFGAQQSASKDLFTGSAPKNSGFSPSAGRAQNAGRKR